MEGQQSECIGEKRPKVGGHELSKIVSFEEAVDASDAIRQRLSCCKKCNGMGEEEKIRKEQTRR